MKSRNSGEPAVHLGDQVLEEDGVRLEVAAADGLPCPVCGAVEWASEEQAGDVGAGDKDVVGGGELGEQALDEVGLA